MDKGGRLWGGSESSFKSEVNTKSLSYSSLRLAPNMTVRRPIDHIITLYLIYEAQTWLEIEFS